MRRNTYSTIFTIFCCSVFIPLLALLVLAGSQTPTGIFNIQNAAPDAPYDWTPISTHYKTFNFSWTQPLDNNSDPIQTYVCITNDTDDETCTVVNLLKDADNFTYYFDQTEPFWDYAPFGTPSRTYYVKLIPYDGISNGSANDTIYFTLTNFVPNITGQTSDSTAGSPNYEGQYVHFTMTSHDDADLDDNQSLRVCKTNSIELDGTCTGGEWCNEYGGTYSDDTDLNCSYLLTAGETASTYNAYFFICDCPPFDLTCPGQCSTGYLHTFSVNHIPNATNVDILPDTPATSDPLTCSYTFGDPDGDSEGVSTFRWYNYTGGNWVETVVTTVVLPATQTKNGDTWICEVTPVDQFGYAGIAVNSTNETVQNSPPNAPTNFQIQDGAASWDTVNFDTHDVTPNMQWTTSDNDSNPVTTYVCISTTIGNRNSNTCDAYSAVTGTNSVSGVTGLNITGTSTEYYLRLTPFDGSENGSYLDIDFRLNNSLPNLPSLLSPLDTHSQTPTLTWTATDPDDGSVDHWPADTLVHFIRVGTAYGDGTYENNNNANNLGEIVDSPMPYGPPGPEYSNNTIYVSIWTTDGFINSFSPYYNVTINLYDYLSDVSDIELTDANGTYSSCVFSTCAINPIEKSNSTVAARVTAIDTDNDCEITSSGHIYLCLNTLTCDETSTYNWPLDAVTRVGSTCYYEFSINKTSDDGTMEFFRYPNPNYKLFVNISGQGGARTSDPENISTWTYATLKAIEYPDLVEFGDGDIQLNLWNPGTNLSIMTNIGNDNLDLNWTVTDPTNGIDTWNLNGSDLQIDDDNVYLGEPLGYIAPVYLNLTPSEFQPGTGLEVCSEKTCSDTVLNETLDTYYHIIPPLGLSPGTYNSTITITIS